MITTIKRSFLSVLALVFAFTAFLGSQAADAATGTVISKKGNVTADGNPVAKGDKVSTETLIVVPPGGRVVIDFGDGIGKVTLEPGTAATIFVSGEGNIVVALQGSGGGASIQTSGPGNYGLVIRGDASAVADLIGGGGGGGIGGATGLGLAGLPSGSGLGGGGGAGTGAMTDVLPIGSIF